MKKIFRTAYEDFFIENKEKTIRHLIGSAIFTVVLITFIVFVATWGTYNKEWIWKTIILDIMVWSCITYVAVLFVAFGFYLFEKK